MEGGNWPKTEAVARMCSVRKVVLRNLAKFTGKHLCQSLFFKQSYMSQPATLLKRDSATSVYCKFCKISKNTFSYKTRPVAASGLPKKRLPSFIEPSRHIIFSRKRSKMSTLIAGSRLYCMHKQFVMLYMW